MRYTIVIFWFFTIAQGYANISQKDIVEKWLAANKAFQKCKTTQQFLEVAGQYKAILEAGIKNGRLFYNLGNAYLKAGRVGEAIFNYRKAKLFIPNDPYLIENLKYARSLVKDKVQFKIPEKTATLRYIFFWHHSFSYDVRFWLFFVSYICFWLVLALKLSKIKFPFTAFILVTSLLLITMGTSIAYEEYQKSLHPPGVLVGEKIAIHKGNAKSYQLLYTKNIPSGVEVRILEKRSGWTKIELPDELHGWVNSHLVKKVVIANKKE